MKNPEVTSYKNRLDNLFKKAGALSGDIELQSHWARYLCVRVSGFIEVSVSSIYADYAQKRANRSIANYVAANLGRFTNPNMERIVSLASTFEQTWGESLRSNTQGKLKAAIDSISANRNRIAHGEDVGVTYVQVYDWYQDVIKVVEMIEQLCP